MGGKRNQETRFKPYGNEIKGYHSNTQRIAKKRILTLNQTSHEEQGADMTQHSHSNKKKHQWQSKWGLANVPENVPFLSSVSALPSLKSTLSSSRESFSLACFLSQVQKSPWSSYSSNEPPQKYLSLSSPKTHLSLRPQTSLFSFSRSPKTLISLLENRNQKHPRTTLPSPTQSLWKYLLTARKETQQLAKRSATFADSFPPRVTFSLALKTTILIPQQPISRQHVDS